MKCGKRKRMGTLAAIFILSFTIGSNSSGETAKLSPPPGPVPVHAPPLPPAPVGLIERGPAAGNRVAITFDACQTADKPASFDAKIWRVLVEKKVKATIFLGGRWMESHPEETKMIGKNPLLEIGNHSYVHPDFKKLSADRMREELQKTQDIQWRLMGKQGVVFRFPFGTYDDRGLKVVAAMGLRPIQWSVVSGDPDPKVQAGPMIREVLAQTRPGSIIIFHINGRGWHTAEALPAIVDGLRKKGLELVTVSELMGFAPPP